MRWDAFSKCHPLVNFVYFLGAIGFAVVIQHPAYLIASCLGGAVYLMLLKGRQGLWMVLGLCPVFLILAAINPLFNTLGEHVLFRLLGRPYTLEALYHGMAVSGILIATLLWFSCYSAVLTSDKFVCLFGSMIPALSMLLVMVLRLIPSFARRAQYILDVRRSIGKGASEGSSLREKVSDGANVLSALTDWAFEGSIVTADSMRARGYGCAKRTSFQIYRFTRRDGILLGLTVLLALAVLLAGGTQASYTPVLEIASLSWGFPAYCLYLMIPPFIHVKEDLQWRISISKI